MFSQVAEVSASPEKTGDINPEFYEDTMRLLNNDKEGKITEFLNV